MDQFKQGCPLSCPNVSGALSSRLMYLLFVLSLSLSVPLLLSSFIFTPLLLSTPPDDDGDEEIEEK